MRYTWKETRLKHQKAYRVVCQAVAREYVMARPVVAAADFSCAFPHDLCEVADHIVATFDGSGGSVGPEVVVYFSVPIAHRVGVADRHSRTRAA